MNLLDGDAEGTRRIDALLEALDSLGWSVGKNLSVYYRWGVAGETLKNNAAAGRT